MNASTSTIAVTIGCKFDALKKESNTYYFYD